MSTSIEGTTQPVLLLLVDISGYTRFMLQHEKELRHSETIVRELLESLILQVDVPLRISRIEGDALFLYAVKSGDEEVWRRRGASLIDRLLRLFETFAQRIVEIGAYSVCNCHACRAVGDLKLKIIAHSGEAHIDQIAGHSTLGGPDVITVHRLAKNSVEEDQYMLMTEAAYRDLGAPDGVEIREGVEELDTGTFETFVFVPEVVVRDDPDFIRSRFSNDNAAVQILRDEISREYTDVAEDPGRGYHFNTGRAGLRINGYEDDWLEGIPEDVIASFAGTGNPFQMGLPREGEYIVDIGSGTGLDCQIAARAVGPAGHVVGVDMTAAMLERSRAGAEATGLGNIEFREGFAETLPVSDEWADLVISNGSVNLAPDKARVFGEMFRVLRPGGRIQIADITVNRPVPESAKHNIDLWTN
jgi:2-polyprenyl-3-methyl-5-hydroxy-6-metoxy-1,4-benzoquinol methylase